MKKHQAGSGLKKMTYELSILIPARNEEFLSRTVNDILKNKKGNTEIIVVLDGQWANPPIEDHLDVTIIYHSKSIGQRAATNEAAKLSSAKYLMKVDAHCSFDKGFDIKMMGDMKDHYTMVPIMKNLHAFDWVCNVCNNRWYQGPVPKYCCKDKKGKERNKNCNSTSFKKDIVWIAKKSPNSTSYRFNKELKFKYFGAYKKKQIGNIVDTMSLQGSCFMCTREKYWELKLCDESWGSWGQQGTEVSSKVWLSGGRVICNKNTWYAHMFRTQKGFNWPYPPPGKSQRLARKISQDMFFNSKYDKQIHPLSYILEKFWPVPDWTSKDLEKQKEREAKSGKFKDFVTKPKLKKKLKSDDKKVPIPTSPVPISPTKPVSNKPLKFPTKQLLYYTDNKLNLEISHQVKEQLKRIGLPIISVSLKPLHNFGKNIHLNLKRGYLTMFKQILAGLEMCTADIIFFTEHDLIYHPTHFHFIPPEKDKFYYNVNVYKVRVKDNHALKVDECKMTSGLCAHRELLLEHYRKRIKLINEKGFSNKMGYEPGTHNRHERVDNYGCDVWNSEYPNLDLCHANNFTHRRWKKEEYRNKRYTKGWTETRVDKIPGWEKVSISI